MASLVRVDGTWPGPVTISAGWLRARARPWNDEISDPMVRLERGGTEFLGAVTGRLREMSGGAVYSPALYPDATRVWRSAGYDTHARLAVMERSLGHPPSTRAHRAVVDEHPDWGAVFDIDRRAFEGFWRMSLLGLEEAYGTNRKRALLVCHDEGGILGGYAIVGTQWGVTYLHRIAVRPDLGGQGLGAALTEGAITWGRASGGRTIVLNVRDDNPRAHRLYTRSGFADTGTRLEVLRYPSTRALS